MIRWINLNSQDGLEIRRRYRLREEVAGLNAGTQR